MERGNKRELVGMVVSLDAPHCLPFHSNHSLHHTTAWSYWRPVAVVGLGVKGQVSNAMVTHLRATTSPGLMWPTLLFSHMTSLNNEPQGFRVGWYKKGGGAVN